jgi:2-polyprenyl-3-methyl-5-hydroxy-6-metoxy-1,4-benzoquinol methylase
VTRTGWTEWTRRLPKKVALAARSLVVPAGPAEPYRFDAAKEYWANVPRAQGANPFNSQRLAEVPNRVLAEEFLREVDIGRRKEERRVGYERAAESLARIESPRVMDYGSGIGFYGYEVLCRRPQAQVTFVDINPANLATIERILSELGLVDRASFAVVGQEDAGDLHFDEQFDFIMSMGVLHHTPHAGKIVRHLTQFLKSDGIFQVMLYNRRYLFEMQCVAGSQLNESSFGRMTDPPVGELANPYSEAYDDEKAKELFAGYELIGSDYPDKFYNVYRFRKPHTK